MCDLYKIVLLMLMIIRTYKIHNITDNIHEKHISNNDSYSST